MNKFKAYIYAARYLFLAGGILLTLQNISISKYPFFILISLLLVTNAQIRAVYLKGNILILSIFIEVAAVLFFSYLYKGYLYLFLYSTMIDSILCLNSESYFINLISGILFSYIVVKLYKIPAAIVYILFYISEFLFLIQLKKEFSIRTDTEVLYDQIRKNNYELEAAKSQLLEYSKQVENITQLEERNRISREIHDSIGHNLTGILMQVDACIQIIQLDKDKGITLLNSVYDNLNQCIEKLRETVQEMHPVYYENYSNAIKNLTDKFQKDTGVNVCLETSGIPYKLFPSIETVLFKNIQEAMTNSVRHGKCKNIYIHFIYKPHVFQLTIRDDGTASHDFKKGFGLSGMEERLQLISGSMSIEIDNGFIINIKIPVEEV